MSISNKDLAWSKSWKDNSYRAYWGKEIANIPFPFACPNCKRKDVGRVWTCKQCNKIICEQCLEGTLIEKDNEMACQACKSKFPLADDKQDI